MSKNYRTESRLAYAKANNEDFTLEELRTGSLLRIADAAEKMAGNYTALQDQIVYLKKDKIWLRERIDYLEHSNAALRGHIKRFKNHS